jgi:replicative DNA helicase
LEGAGGHDYLVELASAVPAAVNWPYFVKIVVATSRRRRLINECAAIIHDANHSADTDTVVSSALERIARATARTSGGKHSVHLSNALESFMACFDSKEQRCLPLGLTSFDSEFSGLPKTGIVTVMGVPGSGKSSLINNIVPGLRRMGGGRIYSYEMGPANIAASVAGAEERVPLHHYARTNRVPNDEERARVGRFAESMRSSDIEICTDNPSVDEIYQRCVLDARRGARWIVVDYVQNLPRRDIHRNDTEAIADTCRTLQRIARELSMLVLVVSQLTAAAAREKKPPMKCDGVGGGAIEQVSDMMIGVYRPCVFESPNNFETAGEESWEERKRFATLSVLKNKFGPCGVATVRFNGEIMKFEDADVKWIPRGERGG